jgi:hypothetical protein
VTVAAEGTMVERASSRSGPVGLAFVLAISALEAATVTGCRELTLTKPFPCSINEVCPTRYTCGTDGLCRPGDGGVDPTALGSSIVGYLVQGDTLYQINDNPYRRTPLSTGWTGATSMAFEGWLYIVHDGAVWRVSASDGSRTKLDTGRNWQGTTNMAWNFSTGKLYAVDSGRLFRFEDAADTNGAITIVGGTDWYSTYAMTSFADSLYIIHAAFLHKLDLTTGERTQLGERVWEGTATRMVKQKWGSQASLYVLSNSDLWQIDVTTGTRSIFGSAGAWPESTTIFCHGGDVLTAKLHVVQDASDKLFRVDATGAWFETDGQSVYSGPTVSAGTSCSY